MGVFTSIERTLGMRVGKKLLAIRDKVEQGNKLEKEDLIYLMNQTARFETLTNRLRKEEYKVNDNYSMEEYELKELVGNIITELNKVHFMNIDDKRNYRVPLARMHILGGHRMSIADVMEEVEQGALEVQLLQKNFDANNDDYLVIGTFEALKKDYNINISITSEDDVEDIKERVKTAIKEVLDKELKALQETIEILG